MRRCLRSLSRYSSSEWNEARRLITARMLRTLSSSSTRSEPVEEPMNTFTPAHPGRRSSAGSSCVFSRVPPMKKAKSQCMR